MACEDGGLARRVAGADQFRSAPIYRSESPTGYSSAGCSPAEPASASPVTDNSSPNPIQRANQIALLNSTAGCRQTRAPRPLPSARGGCHLYFARRVTFLSCADNLCKRNIEMTPLRKMTHPQFAQAIAGARRRGRCGEARTMPGIR
jgi:hypothetical protein